MSLKTQEISDIDKFYCNNVLLNLENKTTEKIYGIYIKYCKKIILNKMLKLNFVKKLKKYCNVEIIRKGVNGKSKKIFQITK